MTIVPSPRAAIQELLARLDSPQARARETAAARLRLLGEPALRPLLAWLRDATPAGRHAAVGVLEALEGVDAARQALLSLCADADATLAARALEAALERAADSPRAAAECVITSKLVALDSSASLELRVLALGGLLRLLRAGVEEALEPLLAVLLGEEHDESLRLAAAPVLEELGPGEAQPIAARLAQGRSAGVRALAGGHAPSARDAARVGHPAALPPPGDLEHALAALARRGAEAVPSVAEVLRRTGALPDDQVETAVQALVRVGAPALPALQQTLDALARVRDPGAAAGLAEAKAVLHLALLRLGSRIALYDLREMLAARPPRALSRLLVAAAGLGDASVAVEIVRLVAAAPELRDDCAAAFAGIVAREKLTRRARAWRELTPAARAALDSLWPRTKR
jgi:hypothetical protein